MQKIYSIAVWIAVSVLVSTFASCTPKEVRDKLTEAESIMEEDPDSALHIITSIDTTDLKNRKDWAKYALLNVRARTKANEVITSDSLISRAVTYYQEKGDSPDLMKSLFYNADILYNQGRYTSSIYNSTQAYDLAKGFKDDYWIAKSAEQMAFIHSASFNSIESLKFLKEAIYYYKKAGKRLNHLYSICDKALHLNNMLKHTEALNLVDSVLSVANNELGDSILVAYALRVKFPILLDLSKLDEATKTITELKRFSKYYKLESKYLAHEADLEIKKHNLNIAELILDSIANNLSGTRDLVSYYIARRNLYLNIGDYKNAYSYLDSIQSLQNAEVEKLFTYDISLSQKDYYNKKAKSEGEKATESKQKSIWIIIIAVITIIIILSVYKISLKKKDEKIYQQIADIGSLTNQIKCKIKENNDLTLSLFSKQSDIDDLKNTIISLFKDKWEAINVMCYEYFEKGESEKERISIANTIKKHIEQLKSPKNLKKIEDSVNSYMNNILIKLREECPFIKEEDIIFISLIYAGLSPRAVCFFTDIKLKNFYTKKRRLVERIDNSGCENKDSFIANLK